MTHDDALLDSIAVLALGALPESQARELLEHLGSCDACQIEYTSLREASNFVGYAAELRVGEIDEVAARRLKSRVMGAIRTDAAAVSAGATTVRNGTVVPAGARRPWLAYGFAAAAAFVAMISIFDDASQRRTNDRNATHVAALERRTAERSTLASAMAGRVRALDARLALVVAPGSKHFAVAGGEVIASSGRVIVALRDLPVLPKGKVYQAWTLANGAKAVAPSITFSPDATGVTIVELPERAANLAAVAVSVEPDGGSKAPTSKPNFVRPLS